MQMKQLLLLSALVTGCLAAAASHAEEATGDNGLTAPIVIFDPAQPTHEVPDAIPTQKRDYDDVQQKPLPSQDRPVRARAPEQPGMPYPAPAAPTQ